MGRKYNEDEFKTVPVPKLTKVNKQYGLIMYTWMCACSTGSRGYGTTPGHAYQQWLKNWNRRQKWYTKRTWSRPWTASPG